MKIGFLTACLGQMPLDELAEWAAEQGFEALELPAWRPPQRPKDYAPRHVKAERLKSSDAARIRELIASHGMVISSLAFYENNLHPDRRKRDANRAHLRKVVDAAASLGVDRVGTFVGGRALRAAAALREAGQFFRELCAYAADRGVSIMIENCPMENWVQFGIPGNFAYSPELWEALFNEVPDENFGLNMDPSHLHWLGIDPIQATRDFGSRIFHAHAKDTEILHEGRQRFGVLAEQLGDNPWASGWWRYRMPGRGAIDWAAFVRVLNEVGYDDVLSIEHEDPEFEGSEEKVRAGLRLGLEHLQSVLAEPVARVAGLVVDRGL